MVPDNIKSIVEEIGSNMITWVNHSSIFADMKPFEVIYTLVVIFYLVQLLSFLFHNCRWKKIYVAGFNFAAKYVPSVKAEIEGELVKIRDQMRKKFADQRREDCYPDLPAYGLSESTILARIEKGAKASEQVYTNDGGNLAGGVYRKGEDHWNFISECVRISIVSNPLHSSDFAYITHLEAEIVRWTLNLYKGDKDACGLCSSGGTESICLAMLAYRQQALHERGVTKPNIVMSETAHPGHDKACHFFNIECRKVRMTSDFDADLEGMKRATDSNTICIIASAPEYGFGNYDPVNDIAAFAQSKGIGCHVDCCLGSYINPFFEELGYKMPY